MKTLLLSLLVFATATASYGSFATTTASGNLGTVSNWSSNPVTKDTLYINHAMTWGSLDWSASSIKVIIITASVSVSPGSNNNVWELPGITQIVILTGGFIDNLSGNNSNHKIIMGTACVWGKGCCTGGSYVSLVPGPSYINASTPCGYTILPVSVISFKGKLVDNIVTLNWVTADETDISGYKIEKSTDGFHYSEVGTVTSLNQKETVNNYHFEDRFVGRISKLHYRVKTIENDGTSQLVGNLPFFQALKAGVSVENHELKVVVDGYEDDFNLVIYDIQGRKLLSGITSNQNSTDISKLLKGQNYIARVIIDGAVLESTKFVY